MSAPPSSLDEWTAALAQRLELPESLVIDIALVLDLARDAAHGVARPAAPLTTFLVGYAAGLRGGDLATPSRIASELALEWAQREQ
jgi:hypothetical protein